MRTRELKTLLQSQLQLFQQPTTALPETLSMLKDPNINAGKKYLGAASTKQSGRRLTPAGRIICFALLRAENTENDAGEARRSPEIIKNMNF